MKKFNCILLVDDDEINNYLNQRLFVKLEVTEEIKIALNGQQGIECLEDHCFKNSTCPEVIILDINMPVMDGFQFMKSFKGLNFKNKEDVKIAVLTSSSHELDRESMAAFGVKYFLNKPLTEDKLKKFFSDLNDEANKNLE